MDIFTFTRSRGRDQNFEYGVNTDIDKKLIIMGTSLKQGDKAPSFMSKDQNGNDISLESLKGKKIILYFYPKDNTPGCTAEACSLRDGYDELLDAGFVVIGVSPDSEKSHRSFSTKYNLPFHLIADETKDVINSYGVWGEKKFMGKKYMGVIRTTFIISEDGVIDQVIPDVNTKNHAGQILELYNN
jgi:thioredoxin-dependent peroxiredoxin